MARALINMAVCTGGISVGEIGLTGGILNVADTDWLNGMHGGRDDGERKTEDAKVARAHLMSRCGTSTVSGRVAARCKWSCARMLTVIC